MSDSQLGAESWQTATMSAGGDCVQVGSNAGLVLVRHSKNPGGPVLSYTRREWAAFIDGVKKSEFDEFAQE
jgi:hypothetical protein